MFRKISFVLTAFTFFVAVLQAQPESSYQYLSGTIDRFPVVLHLHKEGRHYSGYYYYTSAQQPVYVSGNDTVAGNGKIKLFAFVPGDDDNEIFTLQTVQSGYTGEWQKNVHGKSLAVKLEEAADKSLQFDYAFTAGNVTLRPNMKESPVADFEAAAVWPKQQTPVAENIKKIVRELYNDSVSNADISKIFEGQKKNLLDGYIKDNEAVPDSEIVAFPSSYSLTVNQYVGVCYQSPKVISLYNFAYSYTGGAHGNYATSYVSITATNGAEIQLQDVVLPGKKAKLDALLEKHFRKSRKLKPAESLSEVGGLFENKIEANNNFYITGKGIVFNYSPYEIAPYASGEIQVFIPFSDMSDILQPAFKKNFL